MTTQEKKEYDKMKELCKEALHIITVELNNKYYFKIIKELGEVTERG